MEHNEAAADEAAAQLAALSALDGILERLGLDYWLFGGWAVDFWVGRITRTHDDIDLAVWRDDYPGIRQALEAAGWRYEPVEDAATGAGFRSVPVLVELTFVVSDSDRAGVHSLSRAARIVVHGSVRHGPSRRCRA